MFHYSLSFSTIYNTMSILKVVCLCLLFLAVCGPVALAGNHFSFRIIHIDQIFIADLNRTINSGPIEKRSSDGSEQDLDAAPSYWKRHHNAHHLGYVRPTKKPNVNPNGNRPNGSFGGAYHPGYGAFSG